MKRACWLLALLVAPVGCGSSNEGKSVTPIDLKSLIAVAPQSWQQDQQTPSIREQVAKFNLPRAEGDDADAVLTLFEGIGQSAQANVERWKGQFKPPEGKSIDDISQVREVKVRGHGATYLDVTGIYLDRPSPRDSKATERPQYRMLAIHAEDFKTSYHFKLIGPAKTVDKHQKAFEEWLKISD